MTIGGPDYEGGNPLRVVKSPDSDLADTAFEIVSYVTEEGGILTEEERIRTIGWVAERIRRYIRETKP